MDHKVRISDGEKHTHCLLYEQFVSSNPQYPRGLFNLMAEDGGLELPDICPDFICKAS